MAADTINCSKSRLQTFTPVVLNTFAVGCGHPWTMYFVIAPEGNFLVKGNSQEVDDYVKKTFPVCIYKYTFWKYGKARGCWRSNGIELTDRVGSSKWMQEHGFPAATTPKRARFAIGLEFGKPLFYYRRLPYKWLPEWPTLSDVKLWKLTQKENCHGTIG